MAKVTKRDKFVDIYGILAARGETELAEFVAGEIALYDKRADRPRKPTAAQVANDELKGDIVDGLQVAGEPRTATEIAGAYGISVQKASQLLRQLVLAGAVERVEGKGKTKTVFTAVAE